MNARWLQILVIAGAIGGAFFVGLTLRGTDSAAPAAVETEATIWTCSMHPQIQMPRAGSCPICGMDLIPLETSSGGAEGPRSLTLSPTARALAEIQTVRAERREVQTTLRTVGKLEADESKIREISAWVPGRIDRLYIDYTGVQVRKGQNLFDLYSPDLYSAQEELLQAIRAADDLNRSGLESTRRSATRTIEAAREKLRLLGLTSDQIAAVVASGSPSEHVTIVAPISGTVLHKDATEGSYVQTGTHVYTIADLSVLWLKLDVYESDLAWIALDQDVRFTTDTFRGEEFTGTVSFIDPVLDERSRSIKVRVDVQNDDGRLKPGMFARAVIQVDILAEDGTQPLVIPKSASLVTGTRAVVYVADPEDSGQFHGREVVLGPDAGDFVVVHKGLMEGEMVVSNGSFKIDSALQILAKDSMMNPGEGQLGPIEDVPAAFRAQFDAWLQRYFQLSTALSLDDLPAAQAAAQALPEALAQPRPDLLSVVSREAWESVETEISAAANLIGAANDIAAARDAFYDLSVTAVRAVRQFQASGKMPILLYHCPMARDDQGADWLQQNEGTENPYFGSQMYRCGSQTETLIPGPDHTGH